MEYYKNFKAQPIVDIKTNRVCGGELLYRPDGGPLTPEILDDLDNDPVLNLDIAKQSYIAAFSILSELKSDVWISINLSPRFMGDGKNFMNSTSREVSDLDQLRNRFGSRLVIELTEKHIMKKDQLAFLSHLSNIHEIAIDDFGTGVAPLRNMLDIDFGKIKVDKEIIQGIDYSATRQRFLKWLVGGSHNIGVTVCAEGIETASELMYCKRLGIDQGQGWLWSKDLDINHFIDLASPMESAAISLGQVLELKER